MAELGVPPPTSLYPQPPQQQGALSGNPNQMLDLIGNLMRNEAMRRELAGRAALGQAYQGAIQPDGTIDPNKAAAGLRGAPGAEFLSPETITQLLGQQTQRFNLQTAQSQAARQMFGALSSNPSNEELYNALTTAVRNGVPPAEAVAWLSSITNAPNRARAIGIARSAGMSPAQQGEMAEVVDPTTGDRRFVSKAEAQQYPGLQTQLSGDQQESVKSFFRSQEYTGQYSQRKLPLQEALRNINEAEARSPGVFGPGSEGRQEVKAWLQTFAPSIAKFAGVDPKEVASYASAKKYLVQGIRNQPFVGHSDQQLATAVAGNPTVQVTDLALHDLVKTAIASQRAEQAQMLEAQKSGGPKYTESLSKWPAQNDIRAFKLDLMSDAERDKLISSMKKDSPEWRRFNNSVRSAYDAGVMDRENAPNRTAPAPVTGAPASVPSVPRTAPVRPSVPPKPPVPGVALGRRADGSPGWFISDPSRPGKHMEVTLPGVGQ